MAPKMSSDGGNIQNAMEKAVSDGVFPGAVLLFGKAGKILFHEAFGVADQTCGKAMVKNSIFDLASLTKPLATTLGLCVLIQNEASNLLQASIGSILPAFKGTDKEAVTVDMLLRHTAGLPAHRPYFEKMVQSDADPKQIQLELLQNETLQYKPGAGQIYSDLGFMMLCRVLETVGGKKPDRFVADQIYRPLGIKDLFYIPRRDQTGVMSVYKDLIVATQKCPWRERLLVGEVDDENAWAAGGVDGHAGLFGDAMSVYTLCREILDAWKGRSKLLDPQVMKTLLKKTKGYERTAGFDTVASNNSAAGSLFSNDSVGHLGFTGTSFWIDLKAGDIVILLTNRIHPSRSNERIRKFRPLIHDMILREIR